MKKLYTAIMAAALSVSMVSSSLAATQLAAPQVRWSTSKEAVPEYSRVENASNRYKLESYKDGEKFHTTTISHGATNTNEWLAHSGFVNRLKDSGIYSFRVMALGDGIDTLDSEWSAISSDWTFEKPSVQFGTPSNLRWDGTVTRWDAPEIPSEYEQYLSGYEVYLYGDGASKHGYLSTGKTSLSLDYKEYMNDEDVEEYTFSVRAISNTPSVIFHGELVYSDASYNTGAASGSISSIIDSITEGDPDALANAPDTLSKNLADVQVAMQTDAEVLDKISTLESQYKDLNNLNLDTNIAADTGIDPNEVKIVGALLNAENPNTTVSLNIRKPEKEILVDAMAYKNSIQLDFHLEGAVSKLKVPVRITIPIPANINPDFLRILHYTNDGTLKEILFPEIEGNMASFTVSSFSPFVFAEEGADLEAVATPSNADEFEKLAAALPDADPENPLDDPLSDLSEEERKAALSGVRKLVAAMNSHTDIRKALLKDEDTVYKLSSILYHQGGSDIFPDYDGDEIERIMYHSLAFASEFDSIDGLRAELSDIATPSNATGKYEFTLNLYKTADGEEEAVNTLMSPMKFLIPLPDGYTYSSSGNGTNDQTAVSYDKDTGCIVIYTLKTGKFSISVREISSSGDDDSSDNDDNSNNGDNSGNNGGSGNGGNSGNNGGSGSGSSGGKSRSTSRITAKSPEGGKWVKTGDSYTYRYSDGTLALDCWLEITWNDTKHWYYFNAKGVMMTGWVKDNLGNWYYLNPTSNGVYGSMVTGWNLIDGKWYYFNEKGDGFKGTMLYDTTTPDGYKLDKSGVWIQ